MRCPSLAKWFVEFHFQLQTHSGEGGLMYLLFGPAMVALVVIAVIQLRDHFVASR
jgi:hypothetical protein